MDAVTFIDLGREYINEVTSLEPQIYSHGWSANLISAEFDKPISRRYGILSDTDLVGYSFSYVVEDEFHILNLGIDPAHRCKGYGSKLLDYVLKQAKNEGCRLCLLEVRRSNSVAQNLYFSRGFKVDGARAGYYSDNAEDAILMSLDFITNNFQK